MPNLTPSQPHFIEDVLAGQMRSRSLIVAHRFNLFQCLDKQALSSADLATALGIQNHIGLAKLLANLEAMDLVQQNTGKFELTQLARRSLLPTSDAYYGEFVDFFADQFDCKPVPLIEEHLRYGGLLRPAPTSTQWQHYMAAMDRMAKLSADQIALAMAMENDRTLLDLGGGPGLYAIAACKAYSHLHATIFDLPETLQFAQQNIVNSKIEHRISLQAGSVTDFQYGGPFDVIFLSHTIHLFDESTVKQMFSACLASLTVGGRLVLRDLFTDASRSRPALGSLIAMHMWNEGDAYSIPQTTSLLCEAGFDPPSHVEFRKQGDPGVLGSLLIACKSDRL